MKKDKKDKIDLGYDTSKIIFSIGTVVGLFDSDGSFRIRIRKSNEVLRRYALELVFTQQEENRDIADSLVKTIGFGRIYLTPTKVAFGYSSLKGAIARDASFFHIKK
jgi:hypothetical protein